MRNNAMVTNDMVGGKSWFGWLFNRTTTKRPSSIGLLTPLQEQRIQKLKDRLNVPFDEARPDHQEALKALWHASFPETELTNLVSEQWKDMGWQEDEEAFDILYCIAFELMDAQWLAMGASYMQFKDVLEATKIQLERELSLEDVRRIRDLPAYNLLYR
ncbi:hypothetical protein LUZ60_017456 [Juncus effusus]|nr:hypothetical protein LUZ60_017456 [Juncus effusus]